MNIKIDNDGKQKWQSFTASVDLNLPHLFNSEIEAYGADEVEATENLKSMIDELRKALTNIDI